MAAIRHKGSRQSSREGSIDYSDLWPIFMSRSVSATACNAGHGDRNDGNGPTNGLGCTVCGVGSYAAQGNNTCTSCGPNTDTGRNPTAISVAECGEFQRQSSFLSRMKSI